MLENISVFSVALFPFWLWNSLIVNKKIKISNSGFGPNWTLKHEIKERVDPTTMVWGQAGPSPEETHFSPLQSIVAKSFSGHRT